MSTSESWCDFDLANILSLCSGIGGLDLAVKLAIGDSARTVAYVEREAFCCEVLAARMDEGALERCEFVGSQRLRRPDVYDADGCDLPLWPPGPTGSWGDIPEELHPARAKSEFRRLANGISTRLDELRAYGNGVVPVAAAYAFVALAQRAGMRRDK